MIVWVRGRLVISPHHQRRIMDIDIETIDRYRKIAKPIEQATGAKLYGIQPGLTFRWEGTTINLPTSFAVKLGECLKQSDAG